MHYKRFASMTYLENIAKQDITRFVTDDMPGNTVTTEEKNLEIMQKEYVSTSTNSSCYK